MRATATKVTYSDGRQWYCVDFHATSAAESYLDLSPQLYARWDSGVIVDLLGFPVDRQNNFDMAAARAIAALINNERAG